MRLFLRLLAFAALAHARAELPPTPFDYTVDASAVRERSTQRAAWVALDLPLRQLVLFPGDVESVRQVLNTQRAAPLVLSALQEQIVALLTPENRYLSFGAKLRSLEQVAGQRGVSAVTTQVAKSLALPPSVASVLEKYVADRESVWLLRRRAAQSVAVKWPTGPQQAQARKGTPRLALWDRRYVPVARESSDTRALLQAYVTDWYVNGERDGFVVGIRPTADGFAGPAVARNDSRGIIVAPIEQMAAGSPPRASGNGALRAAQWPVTGMVLGAKDCSDATIREAVRLHATQDEGLIVVLCPLRPRLAVTPVSPTMTYAALRPPFWLQEQYRSVPLSSFHLLTTRLAGGGNGTSFYAIARQLTKTPPPNPQSPEFFFLQALFPGTLTNAASMREMLDAPETFAARHLAKVVMDEQLGKEEPWSWEFEVSLFYYWRE